MLAAGPSIPLCFHATCLGELGHGLGFKGLGV